MVCGGAVDMYSVKGLTGWGTPFGVDAGSRTDNFRPPKPFPDIKKPKPLAITSTL